MPAPVFFTRGFLSGAGISGGFGGWDNRDDWDNSDCLDSSDISGMLRTLGISVLLELPELFPEASGAFPFRINKILYPLLIILINLYETAGKIILLF
jgi:hypothetical protein